jgi:hypothetical protein
MRKIYIGYSSVNAPKEFIHQVETFKAELKKDYEILESTGPEKLRSVLVCDIFVAVCDYQSLDLGYEMAVALEKYSKPTLVLLSKSTESQERIPGINHPMCTLNQYSSISEIPAFIKEKELKHFKPAAPAETCESDICAI